MALKILSRREFIKSGLAATAGAGIALSGVAPAFALPRETPINSPGLKIKPGKKALVFIMLDGGNDSFNMLIPSSAEAYREYQKTRSNLAIPRDELLPLTGFKDDQDRTFGLHPAMPELQNLFIRRQASFIANIAPMIVPVSRQQFRDGSVTLPLGLMSHADLFKHWQTARPGERINRGWFGAISDVLQKNKPVEQIPMNISLAGSNIMQNGRDSSSYSIRSTGSVGLEINRTDSDLNRAILQSFSDLLFRSYPNDPLKETYQAITHQAQARYRIFGEATKDVKIQTHFSSSGLSMQLKKVAQTIKAAETLGMQQQTFFLRYIGWDHHDELLNNHRNMLGVLSKALGEFQAALDELNLAERVITFTGSDFGRTLTSNGNGTDHGWGGNIIVMGDPVLGGRIFGEYPSLKTGENNLLDTGNGVLIPTTATDELYAELALWFGVQQRSLSLLFPNLGNFCNMDETSRPLGVLKG